MNIEIINKINLVWQVSFFLNSLTNWFVIPKIKAVSIVLLLLLLINMHLQLLS